NTMQKELNLGEVRGQVDWQETISMRMTTNPSDNFSFVTNEVVRSYNTVENLVLKSLLEVLYNILFSNDYVKEFEYTNWFKEWDKLKWNVHKAYEENIYIKRVDKKNISNRLISKVLSHRNSLYRKAAKLLLEYRRLIERDYEKI